jgi:archaeal flagellar protein FlaI
MEFRKVAKTTTLQEAMQKFAHVRDYVKKITEREGEPEFYVELESSMKKTKKFPNLIYPVGDPIFIHIFRKKGGHTEYNVIQPELTPEEKTIFNKINDKLINVAHTMEVPDKITQIDTVLIKLFDMVTTTGKASKGIMGKLDTKIFISKEHQELFKYFLIRNRLGYGRLDPMFKDPYLEDIHCTGVGQIKAVHKVFEMIFSNIVFVDDADVNSYIMETTERVERPVSDAKSIVDAIMPDGSRANFIYGRDVSLEGSSFTLRKFAEVPVSITQVVHWKTMSAELAAYMWVALENGMNIFICGETASGKTTTLNAVSAFIKPDAKVYTVENTPEVKMPHEVWQHLLTRESGGRSSDITYIDLLIAALRSRPNYIIVGEIRGEEGNIAFQAMQTGHPVMSTFHAGNVTTLVQRLTGHPINIPITFVDNLNIVLIQSAVFREGRYVRRVLSVTEMERYYAPANKMITRQVFDWNPKKDEHVFRGLFNSYILEQKIARMLGYMNTRDIYKDMDLRMRIIKKMIENQIFNYYDVWEIIKKFRLDGVDALPFKL